MSHPSEMEFDLALVDSPNGPFSEHLAGCQPCRERLERLRAEQSVFRAGDEPQKAAWRIRGRLRRRRLWLALPAVAAAAALLLVISGGPHTRLKGGPALALFVKHGAEAPSRWDGAALQEGDAVQLEVQPAGFALATVFSVDTACAVTREHEQAGAGLVPASWTLRGAAGAERLYVAFTQHPISAVEFAAALRRAGACHGTPDIDEAELSARGVLLRGRP